jgi:hypothetical protein
MTTKKNTFTDFIACAQHLVDEGLTTSQQLAIKGGSAGGLLMGAVVNMAYVVLAGQPALLAVGLAVWCMLSIFGHAAVRPVHCAAVSWRALEQRWAVTLASMQRLLPPRPEGLFRCVVADVAFVDVLLTLSDPTIPLTVCGQLRPLLTTCCCRVRVIRAQIVACWTTTSLRVGLATSRPPSIVMMFAKGLLCMRTLRRHALTALQRYAEQVGEWEEFGNPNEHDLHAYIKSYCPITNVRRGQVFPSMLVTGGLHDPRVAYWEPLKWVSKIRVRC